jgi:CMP-N-acetylneuraminic acid synthetase
MNIVGFMPIRTNSKRVPGKSIRMLAGRPLFCWLAETMDRLGFPIHIYCSDPGALEPLLDFKPNHIVFTKRPEVLDGDGVRGIEIYREFARAVPASVYLLTHCTSPFTSVETFRAVTEPVLSGRKRCAVVVRRVQTFSWFEGSPLNFSIPRVQTQLLKPIFVETSAGYCYRADVLEQGDRSDLNPELVEVTYPEDDDIDTESDFLRGEVTASLVRQRRSQG